LTYQLSALDVCQVGLEGIVSKKLDAPYKSGPSKAWLKIKNPDAPATTRANPYDLDKF
jgi:ATP-dependent DNA ligase